MRRFLLAVLVMWTCATMPSTDAAPASSQPQAQISVPEKTVSDLPQIPHVRFDGPVTEESATVFVEIMGQVTQVDSPVVVIEINSPGGNPEVGFEMVKAIEAAGKTTVCVVDQNAISEAFYILQSCDMRVMTSRSKLMIHEPYFMFPADTAMTREEMRKLTQEQDVMAMAWTDFACRRLTMSLKACRARIHENDWWMDAATAMSVGAVDAVEPSVKSVIANLQVAIMLQTAEAAVQDAGVQAQPDSGTP